jgi:hypothetical protein
MLGLRHYGEDMKVQLNFRSDASDFTNRCGADQGFVDQYGVYMTREEAWRVAVAAGQISKECETAREAFAVHCKLYSEDLY